MTRDSQSTAPGRAVLYDIIFGYESRMGRLFDLALIVMIFASVIAVILDSVQSVNLRWHDELYLLEWFFTVLFTVEYGLRIYSSPSRRSYIFSFYGLVDLLSVLPTYLSVLLPGAASLAVIRILRVLRIFRILKLTRYLGEADILMHALVSARRKILVFMFGVLTLVVIFAALIYLIEGPENGFTSIPTSMYWAIVTITTLGYGDITPQTWLGQTIASITVITGYSIIAIPFGIFSTELMMQFQRQQKGHKDASTVCASCNLAGHESDARYCRRCGASLAE